VLEDETVEVDALEAFEELDISVAEDVAMDEVLDESLSDVNMEVEKEPLEESAAR
jgi:hypothetical protein